MTLKSKGYPAVCASEHQFTAGGGKQRLGGDPAGERASMRAAPRGAPEGASLGASAPTETSGSPPPSEAPLGSPRATLWDSAVFVAAGLDPHGHFAPTEPPRFGPVRSVQAPSPPQSLRCLGFCVASKIGGSVVSVFGSVRRKPKLTLPNKSLPDLHLRAPVKPDPLVC